VKDDDLLKAIDQEVKIRPAAILVALAHLSPEPKAAPLDTKVDASPRLPRRNLFQ